MPRKEYPKLPANPEIAVDFLDFAYTAPTTGATHTFYRYLMPKDGDCGYHSLGIPRATVVKQLFENVGDDSIRAMVGAEIETTLSIGDFPENMRQLPCIQSLYNLRERIFTESQSLDEMARNIKKYLRKECALLLSSLSSSLDALTAKELLNFLMSKCGGNPKNEKLSEHKEAIEGQLTLISKLEKEISDKCKTPDLFVAYIQHYIAVPGNYLTLVPGASNSGGKQMSSLDAIAKINRLNINIWQPDKPKSRKLESVYYYHSENSTRTVHLYYANKHFDSLQFSPGLQIKPMITQLWEDRQLNTGDGLQANGDFQLNQWMQTKLHFGNHSSTEAGIVTTISSLPSANEPNLSKQASDMATRLQDAEEALAKFLEGESARALEQESRGRQKFVEGTKRAKAELLVQTAKKEQEVRQKTAEKRAAAEKNDAGKVVAERAAANRAYIRNHFPSLWQDDNNIGSRGNDGR